jgi:hypoxanthine phosphoribosyltransferase
MTDLTYKLDLSRPSRIVTWHDYSVAVATLADRLRGDVIEQSTVLAGVLQGGFIVAQSLADYLGHNHVSTLADGPNGSGLRMHLAADSAEVDVEVAGKTVLVIDEVIDSGRTARFFARRLADAGADKVMLACLFQSRDSAVNAYAALTLDSMPNLILPWRILRDLPAVIKALTEHGPLTTERLAENLAEHDAVIAPEVLLSGLQQLRTRNLIARTETGWRWCT